MNSRFCPKCGTEESRNNLLIDGLCQKCFSQQNPLLLNFKEIKLIICSNCYSYMHKNKWYSCLDLNLIKNIKKILLAIIKEKLIINPKAKITKLEITPLIPKDFKIKQRLTNIDIQLEIQGLMFNKKLKESYEIPIKIDFSICNLCIKKTSNYYEAILQIRPKSKEVLDFIKKDLSQKNKAFITKEEHLKYGYNLYLTSQNYAKNLASLLKDKFNAEIKFSYILFGKKDGKDIYRTTILVRLKP